MHKDHDFRHYQKVTSNEITLVNYSRSISRSYKPKIEDNYFQDFF